jgi:hypothetical protein
MLACNCTLAGTAACKACPNALRFDGTDLPSSMPPPQLTAVPEWALSQLYREVNDLRAEVAWLNSALNEVWKAQLGRREAD